MSLWVINYADDNFKKQQEYCTKTAYKKGKADKVIQYGPNDIDKCFREKHNKILSQKRGGGYWLWKPYIIDKTLSIMKENDYLMYCDSGAYYVDSIYKLINKMKKKGDDLMVFELPFMERKYSKRDAFVFMNCDTKEYTETNQILATYILMKNNENVRNVIKEWLDYMKNDFIVNDEKNILGLDNYEGFIENRHDQTVFSLVSKKHSIIPYKDPSQYGILDEDIDDSRVGISRKYTNINYPQILVSNRKEIPTLKYKLKSKLKILKHNVKRVSQGKKIYNIKF